MKQFYYTSCRSGESVSGQSGFQIRALSAPLSREENASCMRALNYKLEIPGGYSGPFPIKLLYCCGERTGNTALQSVWLGEDPVTKREGNYFSHVLCDLTPEINAKTVLEWWRSPHWQSDVTGINGTTLPEPHGFPAGIEFNDSILQNMTQDTELFEIWKFLLQAWWFRPASGRIFIACEQEKFVRALWALCRILPEGLWKSLSFSTYEKDAMISPAIITCLWNPFNPQATIPQNCFVGTNYAWNVFSDQKTQLPKVPRYIEYIIQSVRQGKFTVLDAFHVSAPQEVWTRRESAEMFYELTHHPATLDVTRLNEISAIPGIQRFVMNKEESFLQLLENFFNCKLLDLWEEPAIRLTYSPFMIDADGQTHQFCYYVRTFLREKIHAGSVPFLDRFFTKWLNRLHDFGFTPQDFYDLLNEAPGSLPPEVYSWAFPRVFRQVFQFQDSPSKQIEYLTKWCFHGNDELCEAQMNGILQSSFDDFIKISMFARFFENDFSGNDENYSQLYFSWPQWSVRLLLKLEEPRKTQFLRYIIKNAVNPFGEAIQDYLFSRCTPRKQELPENWNAELFGIYCSLLRFVSPSVLRKTTDFFKKLPEKELGNVREELKKRPDVFQISTMKELWPVFNTKRSIWDYFKFW